MTIKIKFVLFSKIQARDFATTEKNRIQRKVEHVFVFK
jgi:hypothetical protein